MSRIRFSISVDDLLASQVKAAAAAAGEDVSEYMSKAASERVDREQHVARVFADIDRRIAAGEAEADFLPWPPPVLEPVSAEEAAAIEERWAGFFAGGEHGHGAGGEHGHGAGGEHEHDAEDAERRRQPA